MSPVFSRTIVPRQNDYSTLIGFPEKTLFNLAFCKKFIFCKTLLFTVNCSVDNDSGKFWLISHETSCLWYCLAQPIYNLWTCNYSMAHLQYQWRVFLIYAHNFVNVSPNTYNNWKISGSMFDYDILFHFLKSCTFCNTKNTYVPNWVIIHNAMSAGHCMKTCTKHTLGVANIYQTSFSSLFEYCKNVLICRR